MKWGELPKSVPTPLGPVKVRRASVKKLGKDCVGRFVMSKRTILVREDLKGVVAWQVLFHEVVHVVTTDAGIRPYLNHRDEEYICDAVSNALCLWLITTGGTLG